MTNSRFPWEPQFQEAAAAGDVPAMIQLLQAQATDHAGTPKADAKRHALKLLRPHGDLALAAALAEVDDLTAKELGAILLGYHYGDDPARVEPLLRSLADHDHWEVREWVASACGLVLGSHFSSFYPALQRWALDRSPNVRRAVALAAMYASRPLSETYAKALLDLMEPLLPDRDAYVKKNLGPFAIGAGLLPRYPQPTLERLERWAGSPDEIVCWNVAMAFTAAAARSYKVDGLRILAKLEPDPRQVVKRAVYLATRKLNA